MKILAIERSTRQGSVALLDDDKLLAEQTWMEVRGSGQNQFDVFEKVLQSADGSMDDVDLFAVGRGPGVYSGLRSSLTAAQAFALPEKKPVYSVSSGEVLAWEMAGDTDAPAIVVVGDARRERVWYRIFPLHDGEPGLEEEWLLAPLEELGQNVPEGATLVSPDWGRLENQVAASPCADLAWIKEDRYPSASALGRRVSLRMQKDVPSEPLTPIYMHPPVFVKPKMAD